jgi:spectinomycin phosphotransferase
MSSLTIFNLRSFTMTEKQTLSDQLIIHCLNTHYGIDVAMLTSLPLGADMYASVYKAEMQDASSYFVKLKHGHHHDISTTILSLLHDAGIQQIIPPIKTTHGESIQHIDDSTLIVYPFIKGENGFNLTLTDDQWVTLGKFLKQVHTFKVPPSIQNLVRQEVYSPKWRDAVRLLYTQIEAEPSGDEIALKLRMFMKEHSRAIYRLVDRAEQLAKKVQEQSPEFVLCHADIHGGNVLIDEKGTIFIVDWDDPIMAPKERDLMFIGGGVANVWNNPHEEDFFYKGYQKTEINRTILAYYRHERIVEDIALYGKALLLTKAGGEERLEMYNQFIDMFKPRGVVDIAFKTDEEICTK